MTQLMPDVRQGTSGFADVTGHIEFDDAIVRRFDGGGRDAADTRQVARLGLLKAARHFDPAETLECNKDLASEAMQCGALRKPAALEQLWGDTYEAVALAWATAMEEEGFERDRYGTIDRK